MCCNWKNDKAVVIAVEESKIRKKAYEEGEILDDETDIEMEEDLAKSNGKWKKVKKDSINTEKKDRMINKTATQNLFNQIFDQNKENDDNQSEWGTIRSLSSDCYFVCVNQESDRVETGSSNNSSIFSDSRQPQQD